MLFNSFEFLVFLPLVIMLYFILPNKFRWAMLLGASYYFYMAWRPEYIILIIISTIVDYLAGIFMEKYDDKKKKRKYLALSLMANLGMLFVFKYFNFFNDQFGNIYEIISSNTYRFSGLDIILPMGISFYTFQTLSYTIDIYKGKRKAERHLGYFALYVTYFPQLVAGPIERSDKLIPQLKKDCKFDYKEAMAAILQISWGFFKKIVIADRLAVFVNEIYGDVGSYSGIYLTLATVAFAIQIYCDFSAYSDIAIGSAKIMGVELMENFRTPYFAKSIHEYWSRWHISLSTWFKDYVYIPLGGSRTERRWKYHRNVMIVFLLSGFWHGSNWTYLMWGFLHGLYQTIETMYGDFKTKNNWTFKVPSVFLRIWTFSLILIAYVFFRSESIGDSIYVLSNLGISNFADFMNIGVLDIALDSKDVAILLFSIGCLTISDGIRYFSNKKNIIQGDFKQGLASVFLILFIVLFGYYGAYEASTFIYFQF